MPNHIAPVNAILKAVRSGYPDGIESVGRMLPVLFDRIGELEQALSAFAAKAAQAGSNDGLPLVQVYLRDCQSAYNALDEAQSVPAFGPHVEYLPAE